MVKGVLMLELVDPFIQQTLTGIYCMPGLEGDTLPMFFLFNPHICVAGINVD